MWPASPPASEIMGTRTASASDGAARFLGHPTQRPLKGWWLGCGSSNPGATPARLIDAGELKRLEPALDVGPMAAAEYSPNEGQVEPQMVVDACLRRLREMGCEIYADTEVYGFEQYEDGRIHGLITTSGNRDLNAVVIAAGIGTARLAALAASMCPKRKAPAW